MLAVAMDDFQNPQVQAYAASAILDFSVNCKPEILLLYLDRIVSKLIVIVQDVNQMVQEAALTALASVADLSKEHFQKYYDSLMPYLKTLLENANNKSNHMLRAQAMECISLVMMAVGRDKFGDDAKQDVEVLMSIQGSQMETDDPTTAYMLKAWARLCKCLGQDFLPYTSVVMPPLLQSAQLKPGIIISSADSESDDIKVSLTVGEERFGIKASVLEEKATACKMLYYYVDELNEGFYPWIDQCVQVLVPLLKFSRVEFKIAAVSALPKMLHSAKLAVEKGIAQGRNETYVKQLLDYILPALVKASHKEPDAKICSSMLEAVHECLKIAGPLLDEGQVRSIVDEIKRVLTVILIQKRDRAEITKFEDFDAEEYDEGFDAEESDSINGVIEEEEDLFKDVGDILGELIKTFKAAFLPFFGGKYKTAEERMVAINIFDDVAEHCREAGLKYYDTHVPLILEACNDESSDVRQSVAYGLGICAEHGGSVFKPFVGDALSRLTIAVGYPNALQPANVRAYDNAVSALGKICQFHRDSIDSAQVVHTWLNCLPIKGDIIEAKAVHDQLCSMVERSDGELLGANNQYLPKVVSVFAELLCAGKDLASEQTQSRMINLLRQLQQTLPPASLALIWSSLPPQQQIGLQSILSS